MFWLPLLAAICYGIGIAQYKWLLSRTEADFRTILCVDFIFTFLGSLIAMVWAKPLDGRIFAPRYFFLFGILTLFGIIHNYFLAKGLKRESLHEYELIDLLLPVFTVILAAVTFIDERDPVRIGLALLAAGTFLVTHIRRSQLHFSRPDRWLLYAVLLIAMERVLVKPLLVLADPISLYTFRTGIVALVLLLVLKPNFQTLPRSAWLPLVVNGLLSSAGMILIWTSIGMFGIVTTEIFLMLVPIVLAAISLFVFREQWTMKQGIAFSVILLCIGLVNLF